MRLGVKKTVEAGFYQTPNGTEPVRDWLKALAPSDRKTIGTDIATLEYQWPVGMPLCRSLGDGLWEIRSHIGDGRIARVAFCIARGRMVLLHAFIKKTQKTPAKDRALALKRMREIV